MNETTSMPMSTSTSAPVPTSTPVTTTAVAPALDAVGIRRTIDGRAVVDGVDLLVEPGEIVALVGPSGCGKSTLLRSLAGLEPAEGRVVLHGRDVAALPPERRRIGLVFQDHALFPHLRVEQNVAFGLTDLPRRARGRVVGELLDLVRLGGMGRRFPHELSGGEQQRVALARALAPEPLLVLLDEPFASLDATLREAVRTDVVDVLRRRSATAIMVTHDRDEALAIGDRVAVMRDGRIVQVDGPEAVYRRPVDRFVASFLGDATFVPRPDGTVAVARPHELTLRRGGDDRVVARRFLGSAWRLEVRRADGSPAVVELAAAPGAEPSDTWAVGDACSVEPIAGATLHHVH